MTRAFLLTALLFLAIAPARAGEATPACAGEMARIGSGALCGAVIDDRTKAFLGVPYAESTAGARRWTAPEPRRPWPGVLDATRFGPSCPQSAPTGAQSEDCLSLNVWAPKKAKAGDGRPVMVSIHGGGFYVGSGAVPLLDGGALAARGGVIVVSMNYRLGALGFLATDTLTGNYGFLDQQLALRWVQDNISAFGGDPGKVALMGESAGAMSVGLHLLSAPASAPLFRAAIMQSNFLALPYKPLADARAAGAVFKRGANCADVACLRRLAVTDILAAQAVYSSELPTVFSGEEYYMPLGPVVDGGTIRRDPLDARALRENRKPFLIGANRDETIAFYAGQEISAMDYAARAAGFFGPDFQRVMDRFHSRPGNNSGIWATAMTQYLLQCSSRRAARAARAPVYVYAFEHHPSFPVNASDACRAEGIACHTAELPFVFGSAQKLGARFTPQEERLSGAMMDYWTRFAATLEPGDASGSGPRWPRFSAATPVYLRLDAPTISTPTDPLAEACDFWDAIGYELEPAPATLQRRKF
jgi:carboxylesterase type B